MKIGLVGYQGSGKSTLLEWLTGVAPDPAVAHVGQSAMAEIPDERIDQLVEIYHPKKITRAAIEIVDTPGLSRDHQGNAARLATLREAGCLVLVVAAFGGADAMADVARFDEDLMLADMEIVSGRLDRMAQTLTKPIPRPEREKLEHEQQTLQLVFAALESGKPLRESHMTEEQL
ncbi:MAG: 50S ribosome-binding GTPase, partial [Pirellulales bacterium]|nr:50S ribosome-binding GTPase [Pirellulales bacterium]